MMTKAIVLLKGQRGAPVDKGVQEQWAQLEEEVWKTEPQGRQALFSSS